MVLAHTSKVVLGCVAFGIFWVLAVFPSVPFMPVGRTAGSLLGAMLMVLFRVISPEDAYAAIDLPIIGLLFGTMVVSIFLERADMFKMSHVSSLNPDDFDCVSEPIIRSASVNGDLRSRSVNSNSNAAADADMQFSIRSLRSSSMSHEMVEVSTVPVLDGASSRKFTRTASQQRSVIIEDAPPSSPTDDEAAANGDKDKGELPEVVEKRWKVLVWKTAVYLITLGMLIALLMGLNMSWTAITAALVLLALDFTDAQACLEKVSYSLLIFFCGMFITVDGFNKTGIPNTMWELVEPYSRIDSARGVALLGLVILILSNVASNVPTVLLLGTRVAASAAAISPASERKAWLILAYVSTVAGNLTLLGSAANLIVCEQARRAQFFGYNLSFWSHLRFGVPSTIVVTAIGLLIVSSY
ncbi:Putative transporter arsB [Triticum urartu]|uniref:Putative transporter arsB n=1 Tax=Triticum urartu TaxID=4572 RepID=M8AJ73_TRIUA|nr:Putative transporter arsB [Triticum urartu]